MNVPAEIGNKKVMIEYHVVDAELPLLLSKTGMQEAGCIIDFQKEKVVMFGNEQKFTHPLIFISLKYLNKQKNSILDY